MKKDRHPKGATVLKAWRITWAGVPEESGIYAAESRGGALAKAARALTELGYQAAWTDLRCTRAPEYDAWALANPERLHGISEEYLRREIAAVLVDQKEGAG